MRNQFTRSLMSIATAGALAAVLSCNCSICQRRGHLLWFVPRDGEQRWKLEFNVRERPQSKAQERAPEPAPRARGKRR